MIAIIGSNGQLGWELVRKARNRGYEVLPLAFPEMKSRNSYFIITVLFFFGNLGDMTIDN